MISSNQLYEAKIEFEGEVKQEQKDMMLLMKSYSKADAKNAPERARRSSKLK